MPRKAKSVYERISTTQRKISLLEEQLKKERFKLTTLNKEKDELEMHKMFEYAKENNLSLDEVINALNVFTIRQMSEDGK